MKLSCKKINDRDSANASKLLKVIGDLERISDHAVNIVVSAEEMKDKGLYFTQTASDDLIKLIKAVDEILDLTLTAFIKNDLHSAVDVEPLEQVIDKMKEQMRTNHILRLQQGLCSMEMGFVWSDILTDFERTSDHCSNIAGCVIDAESENLNIHESLRIMKTESNYFKEKYAFFASKYLQKDMSC